MSATVSDKYRIVRRLGDGGMSTVYLAEQTSLGNRPVALKVISRQFLEDPEFLARFRNEAASTALIRHRNIVTVYECDRLADGSPYIAMEYLDGQTLAQLLEVSRSVSISVAANILRQAGSGLSAAHKLGIIHRDLKPANIFLTTDDNNQLLVKILDFGIAKLRENPTHTRADHTFGTPGYMSPEQFIGLPSAQLDSRSDIYSLGVVAYEMLGGRVPFDLKSPPSLSAGLAAGRPIPKKLENVVMKALTWDRDDRYATVADFVSAFAAEAQNTGQPISNPTVLQPSPTPSPKPPETPTRLVPPPTKRMPIGWFLAGVVMVGLAWGFIAKAPQKGNVERPPQDAAQHTSRVITPPIAPPQEKAPEAAKQTEAPPGVETANPVVREPEPAPAPTLPAADKLPDLNEWMKVFLKASEGPDAESLRPLFQDRVTPYFGLSTADWPRIQKDKQDYFRNFRELHYSLLTPPTISPSGDTKQRIEADIHFRTIGKNGQPNEGQSHVLIYVVPDNGQFRISGISEVRRPLAR